MPQRILQFDFVQYLILNIIAHDVIHDYGNADSDRWKSVQAILKDFYGPVTQGGTSQINKRQRQGSRTQTMEIDRENTDDTQDNRWFAIPGDPSWRQKKSDKRTDGTHILGTPMDKLDEYNIFPDLQTFINDIENEISISFFHVYLTSLINKQKQEEYRKQTEYFFKRKNRSKSSKKNRSRSRSRSRSSRKNRSRSRSRSRSSRKSSRSKKLNKMIKSSSYDIFEYIDFIKYIPFIFRKEENNSINDIYSDISDLFYYYSKKNKIDMYKKIENKKDIENLWKELGKFFKENNESIKTVIYSYVDFGKKRGRSSSGGAAPKDKLSGEDAINLRDSVIRSIQQGSSSYGIMQEMATSYVALSGYYDAYTTIFDPNNERRYIYERDNYNNLRKKLIVELTEIYKANKGDKYANSLEQISVMGQNPKRNYDVIQSITRVITSSIESPIKIAAKQEKINEDKMQQIADDIRRSQTGHLTSQDKTLVGNFMKLIAKMGLLLTKCVERTKINDVWSHTINWSSNAPLDMQINALLYVADIDGGTSTSKDIDTTLINYYDGSVPGSGGYNYKNGEYMKDQRLKCSGNNKYIINNAAPIGSLSKLAFCPYTSIIDGMSQCSWNTAQSDGIEYGNMNFKITGASDTEDSLYYNGVLEIPQNQENVIVNNYPARINVGFNINFPGFGKVRGNKSAINMTNADVLDAPLILRNVLLTILLSIPNLNYENIWDDIYDRLLEKVDNPQFPIGPAKIPIFELIYREILFKGVGDFFQEINAVAKYGGYTMDNMDNYHNDQGIYNYPGSSGNQIRCFLAKDRPSGTRFIYMLLNGRDNQINTKAFGGYYNKDKEVLAKHSTNAKLCDRQ